MDAIQQQLNEIQQRLQQQNQRLDNIGGQLIDVAEISYQAFNRGCGDGSVVQYKIIPFRMPDGVLMSPQQAGLPLLTNLQSVEELSSQQLNNYLQRYGIPHAGNLSRRTKIDRLKGFIGCISHYH
ncbi:hypothetical protein F5I97DRAFT_1841056 [Phlebopus sp. FC_14]|nr:hypothetical protein F5I97DRAFT_1841056 [Phlebopus sp. FC_14]